MRACQGNRFIAAASLPRDNPSIVSAISQRAPQERALHREVSLVLTVLSLVTLETSYLSAVLDRKGCLAGAPVLALARWPFQTILR